ncbi:carbonic anhydrase [Synchytrium microbalum]|uniref:Carbonic anhydrase n=1 Tax=Synchytrium microbalum TaxID=1806994 RepID=A0A507BQV7_9FUNG|nr:carbonic anhydrase [Synchytrium microbalum]TPX32140.1 carbonic anhydrase [Synchytrium microbalum]
MASPLAGDMVTSPSIDSVATQSLDSVADLPDKIVHRPQGVTKKKSFNLLDSDNEESVANPSPTLKQFRSKTQGGRSDMGKLLSGFKKFQKNFFQDNNDLYRKLAGGQNPKTLLVGCCDSRVDPAMITGSDPGDLFIIRNVANLVAPYAPDDGHHGVSAAIEYAVKVLKVENIVVLGHVQCGGIRALMSMKPEEADTTEFIHHWMTIAWRAREKIAKNFANKDLDTQCTYCEHASILVSLENLVTYPFIKERLNSGDLTISGWYFDFITGQLNAYNPESNEFAPLNPDDYSPTTDGESRKSLDAGRNSIDSGKALDGLALAVAATTLGP